MDNSDESQVQYIQNHWGGNPSRAETMFGGDDYDSAHAEEFDQVVSGHWCE
jgi:hypothetical protein